MDLNNAFKGLNVNGGTTPSFYSSGMNFYQQQQLPAQPFIGGGFVTPNFDPNHKPHFSSIASKPAIQNLPPPTFNAQFQPPTQRPASTSTYQFSSGPYVQGEGYTPINLNSPFTSVTSPSPFISSPHSTTPSFGTPSSNNSPFSSGPPVTFGFPSFAPVTYSKHSSTSSFGSTSGWGSQRPTPSPSTAFANPYGFTSGGPPAFYHTTQTAKPTMKHMSKQIPESMLIQLVPDAPRFNKVFEEQKKTMQKKAEQLSVETDEIVPIDVIRTSHGDSYKKFIELKHGQPALFRRSLDIITTKFPFFLNLSETGSGKTILTIALYHAYQKWLRERGQIVDVMIVAPASVIEQWKNDYVDQYSLNTQTCDPEGARLTGEKFVEYVKAAKPGVEVSRFIPVCLLTSKEKLRGMKGKPDIFGLLKRIDRAGQSVSYEITPAMQKVIEDGIMFIVDEADILKKVSEQTIAITTITRAIIREWYRSEGRCPSRVVFLTASPFEKPESALLYFYALGIVDTMTNMAEALSQLNQKYGHMQIDNGHTFSDIVAGGSAAGDNVSKVYGLYNVLSPVFSDACAVPVTKSAMYYNYFGSFFNEEKIVYEEALKALNDARCGNSDDQNPVENDKRMAMLTKAMIKVEKSKIPVIERLVRAIIARDKRYTDGTLTKIEIFTNYNEGVIFDDADGNHALLTHLADLNPTTLTGVDDAEKRYAIIKKFNDDDSSRVILINSGVAGRGTNGLNDRTPNGKRPRVAIILPGYSATMQIQVAGRLTRHDTTSDSECYVIYGDAINKAEMAILNCIGAKSEVLKNVRHEENNDKRILPSNYETFTSPAIDTYKQASSFYQ